MRIGVLGLWHLGSVTAACLAALGHGWWGLISTSARVADLSQGVAPVFEPGLEELIKRGLVVGQIALFSDGERRDTRH